MIRRILIGCRNISDISAKKNSYVNILQRPFNNELILPLVSLKCFSDTPKSNTNTPVNKNDRKLRIIKTELTHLREDGQDVPDEEDITANDWIELSAMSNAKRTDYYRILYRRNISIKNEKIKRAIRKEMTKEHRHLFNESNAENEHTHYGLGRNTLLMKVYSRTIDRWRNHKIFRNLLHQNSQLIFDCGFESEMTPYEVKNTAKQLVQSFGVNRKHRNPFFFHFTNLQFNGQLHQSLAKKIPTIANPTLPIQLLSDELPENVSRERLVYLTPHSHNELLEFNDDDIYIIGAIVERGEKKPLTMAKAKAFGYRTARLPLDRFLHWKQSTKVLTIDQITKIMLDLKSSGEYKLALKHVPARKIH